MRLHLYFHRAWRLSLLPLVILSLHHAQAGSATWSLNPSNGSWAVPTNWTPNTVPDGPTDIATFGTSNITSIAALVTGLGGLEFSPGASAYTITTFTPQILDIGGPGITNNSGVLQQFIVPAPPSPGDGDINNLTFSNSATAGSLMQYSVIGSFNGDTNGGAILFHDTANAGSASFINNAATGKEGDGGGTIFFDSTTAATGAFTNNGAALDVAGAGYVAFENNSTAWSATFTNNGGAAGAFSGGVSFLDTSSAGDATLINNGGGQSPYPATTVFEIDSSAANATLVSNGGSGSGGAILFNNSSRGDSASVKLFGNGLLDISAHDSSAMTLGSLEGDGLVYLGSRRLTVGRNRLSTTFSGVIQDGGNNGGTGGSFAKVGSGTLLLTGANTYTGTTSVNGGVFTVSNTSGSGTGTSAVQVNAGILGGTGTIAGAVTIGAETEDRPHLAPASGNQAPATLTIQSALTFKSNGGYNYLLRGTGHRASADRVNANGVTIDNGATFSLLAQVRGTLPTGTVFTAISNTSGNPISGAFSNLADGAILTVSGNNLQASYEGGDGNDLTLTVGGVAGLNLAVDGKPGLGARLPNCGHG